MEKTKKGDSITCDDGTTQKEKLAKRTREKQN